MSGVISRFNCNRTARVSSVVLAAALAVHPPLSTAIITVDGSCSLADAITSANTDSATGGCAAGSGADQVELTADVVLTSALPQVTSEITFEGNEFTVGRDGSVADFGILDLDVDGGVALHNITLTNGVASRGGGIRNEATDLELINAHIVGNEATTWKGGGIYSHFNNDTLTIVSSTLADNEAALDGGALYTSFITTIDDSTISGNTAGSDGGGIFNLQEGYLQLTNSTLSGNSAAGKGGAVYNEFYYSGLFLESTTIVGNTASTGGGFYDGLYAFTVLDNSIIAANVGGNCVSADQVDQGGNFDDDGSCAGASPIAAGIDFDANLAENGGPTPTHALLPGSVAIDTGGACGLTADQRGFARDALCDSGSVEFGAAPVGGTLEDIRGVTATCRNNTTGTDVTFPLGPGDTIWDCEAQGLTVSPGDTVTQSVQGAVIDGAGGTVIGLAASRVSCRNVSAGTFVNIDLSTGPSWDCVEAGLVVNRGDRIRMLSRGQVP